MSPTIKDVAEAAGVGIGTVSRVLNDSPSVRPETRARVQDVIARLNYHPNAMAQGLSRRESRTIGVLVPFLTMPFFVTVMEGIDNVLSETDYDLIVLNVDKPDKRSTYLQNYVYSRRLDGLIGVTVPFQPEEIKRLAQVNCPIVAVDNAIDGVSSYFVNNTKGGELAMSHLLALGHTKIGYLGDLHGIVRGVPNTPEHRYTGYLNGLEKAGIPFDDRYTRFGIMSEENGYKLTKSIMEQADPPTALFVYCDTAAVGALKALREMGLRVPEDISVVGFDDIDVARHVNLTTIRQPMQQYGVRAAQKMLELLSDTETSGDHHCFDLELIERGTTAKVAV